MHVNFLYFAFIFFTLSVCLISEFCLMLTIVHKYFSTFMSFHSIFVVYFIVCILSNSLAISPLFYILNIFCMIVFLVYFSVFWLIFYDSLVFLLGWSKWFFQIEVWTLWGNHQTIRKRCFFHLRKIWGNLPASEEVRVCAALGFLLFSQDPSILECHLHRSSQIPCQVPWNRKGCVNWTSESSANCKREL